MYSATVASVFTAPCALITLLIPKCCRRRRAAVDSSNEVYQIDREDGSGLPQGRFVMTPSLAL
jgi:hypothetical protein